MRQNPFSTRDELSGKLDACSWYSYLLGFLKAQVEPEVLQSSNQAVFEQAGNSIVHVKLLIT